MTLSFVQYFTNISLESLMVCKKEVQLIGMYRKFKKIVITLLMMEIILSFLGASIAYAGFRDSTADPKIREIKNVKGTSSDDIIYGTDTDDRLDGKNGNDSIYGFSGNDRLTGGNGNDILEGGPGNDILIGGNGNDVALYSDVFTDYTLVKVGNRWFVTNTLGEIDKVQKLEELHFSDRIIYLDDRNNAPTTLEEQLDVNEDDITSTLINVISNDSDFDGDPLTISNLDTQNTLGLATIVDSATGTLSYNPNGQFEFLSQGEIWQDTLLYEITDGNGGSASQIVKANILGANDAPIATDLAVLTDEGVSITSIFIADDIDNDDAAGSLGYSIIEGPTYGTISLGSGNSFTYDPSNSLDHLNAGELQDVTFDYSVTDQHGAVSQTATVTITVYGLSNLPAPTLKLCSPEIFSEVGNQIRVSEASSVNLSNIASTTLSNGDIVVVWAARHEENTPFTAEEVYGQLYNSQGVALGSIFQVNTFILGGQKRPDITALSNGGFVIAWESDQENGSLGVYSQRFDSMGAKIAGDTHVNTFTDGVQNDANVGSLASGGHVIVWTSSSKSLTHTEVHGQIFDVNGQPVGEELLINSHLLKNQFLATVTGLENGGFVAAWKSERQDDYNTGSVYAQVFDVLGNKAGDEFRVNTYQPSDQTLPDIVATDGGFIVAWSSFQDGSSTGIYSQRFDLDGQPVGLETQVNTITKSRQADASITSLTDGGYVITWRGSNADTGKFNSVSGQRYDQFGNCVGDEFLVDLYDIDTKHANFYNDVTATDDGGFLLSWARLDDEDNLYEVLAQKFSPSELDISPDGSLSLKISISHEGQFGDITLSVLVNGLPTGSVLSAGILNPDGSWTLDEAELDGLTLSVPLGFTGDLNLVITATATNNDTGEFSNTSQPLSLYF